MQQRSALAWLPAALLALVVSMGAPAQEFLPPQEAFKYSAEVRDGQLQLRYQITDGYYLYRNRLGFEASGAALGTPSLPRGEDHEDDYFGRQEIYRGSLAITIPIQPDPGARDFELTLKLQGCADGGLCYPPQTWKTRVNLPAAAASTTLGLRFQPEATAGPGPAGRRRRVPAAGPGLRAVGGQQQRRPGDDPLRHR